MTSMEIMLIVNLPRPVVVPETTYKTKTETSVVTETKPVEQ